MELERALFLFTVYTRIFYVLMLVYKQIHFSTHTGHSPIILYILQCATDPFGSFVYSKFLSLNFLVFQL